MKVLVKIQDKNKGSVFIAKVIIKSDKILKPFETKDSKNKTLNFLARSDSNTCFEVILTMKNKIRVRFSFDELYDGLEEMKLSRGSNIESGKFISSPWKVSIQKLGGKFFQDDSFRTFEDPPHDGSIIEEI